MKKDFKIGNINISDRQNNRAKLKRHTKLNFILFYFI